MFDYFFFNDTPTTEIYTLSLHDALPIYAASTWCVRYSISRARSCRTICARCGNRGGKMRRTPIKPSPATRSEEHTSELQSRRDLVCRLLLEKKNQRTLQQLQQTNQ